MSNFIHSDEVGNIFDMVNLVSCWGPSGSSQSNQMTSNSGIGFYFPTNKYQMLFNGQIITLINDTTSSVKIYPMQDTTLYLFSTTAITSSTTPAYFTLGTKSGVTFSMTSTNTWCALNSFTF